MKGHLYQALKGMHSLSSTLGDSTAEHMNTSIEYPIAQRVEVVYDPENGLHRGADTSAESPERVTVLVKALTELGLPIRRFEDSSNIRAGTLSRRNCSACTFEMGSAEKVCSICATKSTHTWAYTQDVDGDTTFETPYTTAILQRARTMILGR